MTTIRLTMMVLMLATLAQPAAAMPVTFAWEAGALAGWYTFESETVGVRTIEYDESSGLDVEGELRYVNAITAFQMNFVAAGERLSLSGTSGDLALALYRGPWGETWYSARMATPNYSLWLTLFNASGEPFIASEDLRDAAVPDLNDEIRPGTDRWLTLTHRRSQATLAESAVTRMWRVTPTAVPEPTSLVLFGTGFGALALARRRWRA